MKPKNDRLKKENNYREAMITALDDVKVQEKIIEIIVSAMTKGDWGFMSAIRRLL